MKKLKDTFFDLSLTPEVLQRFKLKSEDLDPMADPPNTWADMAVMHVVGQGLRP